MKCEDSYSFEEFLEFVLVSCLWSEFQSIKCEIKRVTLIINSEWEIKKFLYCSCYGW